MRSRRRSLSVSGVADRYGLLIAWAVVLVTFSILLPDTFFRIENFQTILGSQALLLVLTLGLIVPLTRWVLETACGEAMRWRDQALPPIRIAVNLSPVQFRHRGLIEMVETALERSGLPGHLLELDVQEAALAHDRSDPTGRGPPAAPRRPGPPGPFALSSLFWPFRA